MKEIMIVRHARSEFNIHKSEDLNSGITEFGKTQAIGVGKFLAKKFGKDYFVGFTSPFLRCTQTASYIKDQLSIDFRVMEELSEHLQVNQKVSLTVDEKFYCPGGDKLKFQDQKDQDFLERMYMFLEKIDNLCNKVPFKVPLVITHGTPGATLVKILTERTNSVPVWDYSLDNCSLTWIKNGRLVWHGRNLHHEPEASY